MGSYFDTEKDINACIAVKLTKDPAVSDGRSTSGPEPISLP